MNQVLRAFTATVDDVNNADRSLVAKINSSRLDYYRTVIDPRGADFRDFQRSPVVLWCHGKDMKNRGELPVGRNLWIRADKGTDPKIIAKTRFAKDDFSQALYEAYRSGDITGWSISMIPNDFGPPTEREIRERPELRDCETMFRTWSLAEYSCVPCPGNPDCLTIDEARSLEKLVSRGIGIPDAYQDAITRLSTTGGLAGGGALVVPDCATDKGSASAEDIGQDAAKDAQKGAKDGVKPKKKRASDGSDDDDDDDDDDDSQDDQQRSTIDLPPLANARTFQQIYHSLTQEEFVFRTELLRRLQEQIDWYHGKV